MRDTWEKEVMGRYLMNILRPLLAEFLNKPRPGNLDDFQQKVIGITVQAKARFIIELEPPNFDFHKLSRFFQIAFHAYTASFMNEAWPAGYPFIISVVITEEDGYIRLGVMERRVAVERLGVLNKEAFPLIMARNLDDVLENDPERVTTYIMRCPEDSLILLGV